MKSGANLTYFIPSKAYRTHIFHGNAACSEPWTILPKCEDVLAAGSCANTPLVRETCKKQIFNCQFSEPWTISSICEIVLEAITPWKACRIQIFHGFTFSEPRKILPKGRKMFLKHILCKWGFLYSIAC